MKLVVVFYVHRVMKPVVVAKILQRPDGRQKIKF